MNAVQQFLSPVRQGRPRRGSPLSGANLRHLDYAAWHAHIAGHAGRPARIRLAPEQPVAHADDAPAADSLGTGQAAA